MYSTKQTYKGLLVALEPFLLTTPWQPQCSMIIYFRMHSGTCRAHKDRVPSAKMEHFLYDPHLGVHTHYLSEGAGCSSSFQATVQLFTAEQHIRFPSHNRDRIYKLTKQASAPLAIFTFCNSHVKCLTFAFPLPFQIFAHLSRSSNITYTLSFSISFPLSTLSSFYLPPPPLPTPIVSLLPSLLPPPIFFFLFIPLPPPFTNVYMCSLQLMACDVLMNSL